MDSAAYLRRQGWKGDGHSLDVGGRGIHRPLLVSKKVDVLGVGLNKHMAVSDQWWMRAFDQGLKNFGTGKSSALRDARQFGVKYSGLYGRFVKGEGIAATIQDEEPKKVKGSRKRKLRDIESGTSSKSDMKGADGKRVRLDADRKQKRTISRQAKAFIEEAEQQGLIPVGPQKKVKTDEASSLTALYGAPAVSLVFDKAGLSASTDNRAKRTALDPTDKANRARLKRRVKRAAKEFLASQTVIAACRSP